MYSVDGRNSFANKLSAPNNGTNLSAYHDEKTSGKSYVKASSNNSDREGDQLEGEKLSQITESLCADALDKTEVKFTANERYRCQ